MQWPNEWPTRFSVSSIKHSDIVVAVANQATVQENISFTISSIASPSCSDRKEGLNLVAVAPQTDN